MILDDATVAALLEARHGDPFSVLGPHRGPDGHIHFVILQREATAVRLRPRDGGEAITLTQRAEGLFEGTYPAEQVFAYELLVTRSWHPDEERVERDPYGFWLQLSEWDLDRFREGRHHDVEQVLGARPHRVDGCAGTLFAVWAPAAESVGVAGDWNGFDGRWHPMRLRHPYGVWELFIPGVSPGAHYKYQVSGRDGRVRAKADPYARMCEVPPATASIVAPRPAFAWNDGEWLKRRGERDSASEPMAIYEVHIGSWQRDVEDGRIGYREMADQLVRHCQDCGFNWVEFLPLAAHPFEGSWGYQVTGQYAPNSRHGSPDDLRYLVDALHAANIGVIVDYVPAHFPKDDFALATFDGHPCYEYGDPKEGEHKGWGTLIFNYRRPEVRNYLIGAALYWLREFHIDALRVDAVSAMLYRNYSREEGEWIANEHGGIENVEAVEFLKEFNATVHLLFPGVITIAEESTAWVGVTRSPEEGGLGFDLKWNMGWMHDTLRYLGQDPVMRSGVHDWITFHQWYAYDERWVLPLSHDEVVHGKGSLLDKAVGADYEQRLAQLRLLQGWQVGVPGRPLLFQGGEWGQGREWSWERNLDWDEAREPGRKGAMAFGADVRRIYAAHPALSRADDQRDGYRWVDCENRQESVIAFLRQAHDCAPVMCVFNFTPVDRPNYPLGVPSNGPWRVLICSDAAHYGGTGGGPTADAELNCTGEGLDGWAGVVRLDLPPLSCVFVTPA
ncbi:MAG: 1,4-alpha-glucan branching protein GlgB [Planctomycetota bacterium]|nr:1,4-alpha-glucan branching protein GlgB [Planctomycetota bacterium]